MTLPPIVGATVIVVTWTEVGNPDCAVFGSLISAQRFAGQLERTRDIQASILTRNVMSGTDGK